MKQVIKVFKFGGSSLKSADAVKNVTQILKTFGQEKLVIIVSAMGKTTDGLQAVAEAHAAQDGQAQEKLKLVKDYHYGIMNELFASEDEVYALVNDSFVEIEWILDEPPHPNYDFMYDQLVSIGELVSSKIVAAYLNKAGLPTQWLDARDIILTDDIFREGWVQWEETEERAEKILKPMLEQPGFVLTQGFIGSTTENFTTTLGREGSDYSAAIFSYCLNAESMTIWKDVPGVLTGDPRLFDNVTKLDRLSYKEAIEMTYYGAKVIHPKTIKPLQNKSIPLYVKSFIEPSGEGTCISSEAEDTYPPMVAIESHQALLQISTRDFSFVAEHHMSQLMSIIADLRLQVNMMQNSAISFRVCVNDIDDKVDRFARQIEKEFKVIIDRNLEMITVRHPSQAVMENLRQGKIILMEESIEDTTVQFVAKQVPIMKRKELV
ncbi:MAG TPA: aspartate kinase [Saprospiraceae bacterium]|nr:aspartate kinase [Saprospiraceae bacterium]HMQ85533.1 aspartate kinase [Saprospiraceae bacterium]